MLHHGSRHYAGSTPEVNPREKKVSSHDSVVKVTDFTQQAWVQLQLVPISVIGSSRNSIQPKVLTCARKKSPPLCKAVNGIKLGRSFM